MMNIPYLRMGEPFPHASQANEHGIVAYGGDLSPTRLLNAYRAGIFPWYSEGDPILWWSPNPRCILLPEEFVIRRSLAKRIRNGGFEVKFDHDFRGTIESCRKVDGRDKEGTWILPEIIEAYDELYGMGYAHSIETYLNGELVGGLYGVSIGGAFFGESMFSKVPDASKIALAALTQFAKEQGFLFVDCQIPTEHLLSLGAICVERDLFLEMLDASATHDTLMGSWRDRHVNLDV